MTCYRLELTRATADDAPRIRRLAESIWRAVYPEVISVEQIEYMLGWMYSVDAIRNEIESGSARYELLEIDNASVGFAAYGEAAAEDDALAGSAVTSPAVMLHKLYLDPAYHRRGIGSHFLVLVEAQIRCAFPDHRSLILRVNRANERAIRSYRRNGFIVTGETCSDIGEGFFMDDYWMTKAL